MKYLKILIIDFQHLVIILMFHLQLHLNNYLLEEILMCFHMILKTLKTLFHLLMHSLIYLMFQFNLNAQKFHKNFHQISLIFLEIKFSNLEPFFQSYQEINL